MPFKLALVEQHGLEEGFRIYKTMLRLPDSLQIHHQRLGSLHDFALKHALAFAEVYPADQQFSISPPRIIGPSDHRTIFGRSRSFFVACLPDGRIGGPINRIDTSSAFIEVNGNFLLDRQGSEPEENPEFLEIDPFVFHATKETAWIIPNQQTVMEVEEAFVSLVGPYSKAFGHWMWEYLPRYVTAVATGALPPVPILIEEGLAPQLRDALTLLLPDGVEVLELPPFTQARVRRLWCAPSLMYPSFFERVDEGWDGYHHQCLPPVRFQPYMRKLQKRASDLFPTGTGDERIFLARKESLHRKLLNSSAIESLAESRGFRIVYPEDHSFFEQVRLIRHARYVLGPEGSAMFLNFFARSGTKLCILNHPFTLDVCTFAYLFMDDIDITIFTGPAERLNSEPGFPHFGFQNFADYVIDETAFASFMDEWLT